MRLLMTVLILLLAGCSTTQKASMADKTPQSKQIYYLQHRVMPQWTFESNNALFSDLQRGDLSRLRKVATELISSRYAKGISVTALPKHDAVLVTFPTPKIFPNCYYVVIAKHADGFSFYTYEKTMKLSSDDTVVGVVGTWSPDGSHGNKGPRTYHSADEFVGELFAE